MHCVVCIVLIFLIEHRLSLGSVSGKPEALSVCDGDGFKCIDSCRKLVRCLRVGNMSFSSQVIRNCEGEGYRYCNSDSLDCSANYCDDDNYEMQNITCYDTGIFPHPRYCTSYYNCNGTTFQLKTCVTGTAYNATAKGCSAAMFNERPCTEGPIPKCMNVESIGVYPEDASIFYVCAYNSYGYLLPELRLCKSGYIFDKDLQYCIVAAGSNTTSLHLLPLIIISFLHIGQEAVL